MLRRSDWLSVPRLVYPPPGSAGGVREHRGVRYFHRSLLPSLPPAVAALVGAPLRPDEHVSDVDTSLLRPYQQRAARFARERDGAVIAHTMGCIAGETVINVNRAGKGCRFSLRDAWRKLHRVGHPGRVWRADIRTFARALCGGELRQHLVIDIVDRGVRPVLRLSTASGKSLRLTADHEVACADGSWLAAGRLRPGTEILAMDGGTAGRGGLIKFVPEVDRVVSVEPGGESDVYDLIMADPHRNFVANGIVVHNCGKTRVALCAVRPGGSFVGLVVAPKVTWGVWRKEIALVYGPGMPIRALRGRKLAADRRSVWEPGIFLLNPELIAARWMEWLGGQLDFVILDEAHLYTRGGARRTQAVAELAKLARHRVALTGTPIVRHVMDLAGILRAVVPGAFGSWRAMALWLGFKRTAYGWDLGLLDPAARARLDDRLTEVVDWAQWTEVSDSVPPLQRERLPVDLAPDQREAYDALASDVRKTLAVDEITLEQLQKAAALVQVSALRRFVARAKVPHVVDLVRSAGEPVVVWTWHREVAREIARRLRSAKLRVALVTGAERDSVRADRIAAFQAGKADVFVGTIAVGGVGIDLTRARITVYAELSWVPADIAQSEARVFRQGQERPCVTYWPLVADTIEERMIEVLIAKADHARTDIFPDGVAPSVAEDAAKEMISLIDHAMEEDDA